MNGQYLNFHTYEGYVYQTWSEAESFVGKAMRNKAVEGFYASDKL
jgi:hypothetical protein